MVRSGMRCYGWPPSAPLCPEPVPGSKSTLDTPTTTRPNAPGGPSHGLVAKVRVAGSSPVVRSKALLRGHFPSFVDTGRASPCKGEGRGLEPRRCAREAAGGGGFRAPA